MLPPTTPLADLAWITKKQRTSLTKLGLDTLADLVTHYPRRHEDRRHFVPYPDGDSADSVLLSGTIVQARYLPFGGWKKGFEATLEEPSGLGARVTCRWFNMPYIGKQLMVGQQLVVYGKTKLKGKRTIIDFPEYEILEAGDPSDLIHLNRIVPVHPAGEGLTPKKLREIIHEALKITDLATIPRLLPGLSFQNFKAIHFPATPEAYEEARSALVGEEFFAIQSLIAARRAHVATLPGSAKENAARLLRKLLATLPFLLTDAQARAVAEIKRDLARPTRMTRLLQGDVGSGKTLVALAAALTTIESGHQAILMAPTQILANQHYKTLKHLCEPLGVEVKLRMGNAPVPGASGGVPPPRIPQETPAPPTETRYSKSNLPHFERPWAKYMITFTTIPRRHLTPTARQIVLDAILHIRDVAKWHLYAACVMPDHVHLLVEPQVESEDAEGRPVFHRLATLLHSLKSYTVHEINHREQKKGPLWEKESFDRIIRSEADLQEKFHYICRNPWTAKIADENSDYPHVWWPEKETESAHIALGSARVPACERAASPPPALRRNAEARTRDGRAPQLLIGTHALLHDPAELDSPGLVIIDEQHKFGVLQRAKLIEGPGTPDLLVMTATPIPRTLAQTAYGDLDVTTLDELPPGRGKIITGIRPASKLPEAANFLRAQIEAGRQVYIVYPLIDESEKLAAKAATEEFTRWSELLSPHPCGLLHGRLKSDEKNAAMTAFRAAETKVLISTTVIEVGVDVPNATVMLIENAERFGLAQLHQLRGRIGRGTRTSYCILVPGEDTPATRQKLEVLEKTNDGFVVAEADLQLRGPGDLIGTAQTGLPPLRLGNLLRDQAEMLKARDQARKVFKKDPHLEDPSNANLKAWLARQNSAALSG